MLMSYEQVIIIFVSSGVVVTCLIAVHVIPGYSATGDRYNVFIATSTAVYSLGNRLNLAFCTLALTKLVYVITKCG